MIRAAARETPGRPGRAAKTADLLRIAARDPVELYDRVRARLEVRDRKRRPVAPPYEPARWHHVAPRLEAALGGEMPLSAYAHEFEDVHAQLAQRATSLAAIPFPAIFDADPILARIAYTLARALRPELVVETGVALGVVSSCILAALEHNGRGRLVSIDLPPLGVSGDAVGQLVPPELRPRWRLERGSSTRVLPRVLANDGPVGLFVHDSLFTWRNSTQEYRQVLPHLASRGAIVANCVQHSPAFAWLVEQTRPTLHAALAAEQKPGELIGLWLRTG